MGDQRQNWVFADDTTGSGDEGSGRIAQRDERDALGEPTFEDFKENYEAFSEWMMQREQERHLLVPENDDEARVYTCPGWRIYSPRWNEEEALRNKDIKQWEALLIVSRPQSLAWVKDHFPRCSMTPLRTSDRRQAETRLKGFREKRKGLRKKDSYTPTDRDMGGTGAGDVL